MELKYIIKKDDNYTNVKEVLRAHFGISDRLLLKLKKSKQIFLNNNPTYVTKTLSVGDEILVVIDTVEDNSNIVPTKMDLDILYEDEFFIAVNKRTKYSGSSFYFTL